MGLIIFAGKGGVGKSTSAASYALNQSEVGKVLLADYDGGHSLTRVLGLEDRQYTANTINKTGIRNLNIAVIDQISFESIADAKVKGKGIGEYLDQFKGAHGMVPFCDMITTFFGAPTDIVSTSKFASLISLYGESRDQQFDKIILDVEPTAGLERLLNSTSSITRSIQNLQKTGWVTLNILGAKWPDISSYLRGSYIGNAEEHIRGIMETAEALRSAKYQLVTIPERSPVDQLQDIEGIIASYGGKVDGYLINNIRQERHEAAQIQRIKDGSKGKPVVEILHDEALCDSNATKRRKALREAGKLIEGIILT